MKLDRTAYEQYWDKGWVVVEGVFTPDQAERAAGIALDLANKEFDPSAGAYKVDRSADGTQAAPRKIDEPFRKNRWFGEMIFGSALPDLIEQLIGVAPLWHSDQGFLKPPRHGSAKAYHQDNAYFLMHPDDHVVTAWIAMDDVDESNGCLRYINGSHRLPILPAATIPGKEHELTPDASMYDITKEALAPVRKGGVVFHHSKTLHCSGANTSDRWRRGYATHWIGEDVTGENEVWATGYFLQPELFNGIAGAHARRHAERRETAAR